MSLFISALRDLQGNEIMRSQSEDITIEREPRSNKLIFDAEGTKFEIDSFGEWETTKKIEMKFTIQEIIEINKQISDICKAAPYCSECPLGDNNMPCKLEGIRTDEDFIFLISELKKLKESEEA